MWDYLLLFVFSTTTFYSTYSAMSMAHTHVLHETRKGLRTSKVWNNYLACHRGYRSWEHLCVTKIKHSLTIRFCRDELSLAMLFWEDMIASISMLEVLLFLLSIWTYFLNHLDLNIHATINKTTLRIMLGSIPHQKFCFYHLPTRGRKGIKLGDVDTSPSYL